MRDLKLAKCGDCGATEGEFHRPGCDMERCPFCHGQLLSCDCMYDLLGIRDREKYSDLTAGLPPAIYTDGLTGVQYALWNEKLQVKGRIRFIQFPQLCGMCGEHWPDFFFLEDEEWERYIPANERKLIICRPCFDWIKELTDAAEQAVSG